MKFSVSTTALLKELQTLNGAISTNTVLPILEDFLFNLEGNQLHLIASDLETSMSSTLEVTGAEDGKIAIPARIILDTLKQLPDQPLAFDIDLTAQSVQIKAQNGNYKLVGENGDDFPQTPQLVDAKEIQIDATVLSNAFTKSIFAVSNDELRPAMTGVLMKLENDNVTVVATDAHKLVKYYNGAVKGGDGSSFIIPKKAVTLVKNALSNYPGDVEVNYNNTNAFFKIGSVNLICRLIDAKYPDFNAVIPTDNPYKLTIGRTDLLTALKRISIYSSKTTYQVRLDISASHLNLLAQDIDFSNEAKEQLPCSYDGEEMEIAFNARFLIEILSVLDAEQIEIQLSSPSKAALIVPAVEDEHESVVMLLSPIMINV